MKKFLSICLLWGLLGGRLWSLDVPTYLDLNMQCLLMCAASSAKNDLLRLAQNGIFDQELTRDSATRMESFRAAIFSHWENVRNRHLVNDNSAILGEDSLVQGIHWVDTQINLYQLELNDRAKSMSEQDRYNLYMDIIQLLSMRIALGQNHGHFDDQYRRVELSDLLANIFQLVETLFRQPQEVVEEVRQAPDDENSLTLLHGNNNAGTWQWHQENGVGGVRQPDIPALRWHNFGPGAGSFTYFGRSN